MVIATILLLARNLVRRAPAAEADEQVGALASAFNHMLGEIEDDQRELERRVLLRTCELSEANDRLKNEMEERSRIELELRQAQKLESVGRLAAGIAHEINTPIQFVGDSCEFLRDAVADLRRILAEYRRAVQELAEGGADPTSVAARLAALDRAGDLAYLDEEMPRAAERALSGVGRVAAIVSAMKEFAYPERREKEPYDLNHAIGTTLLISRNEYKHVAEVKTELGELPPVVCHIGEFNQVILNLVVNAAHAIGEVVAGTEARGEIRIRTEAEGGFAKVSISDTGGGIAPAIIDKIFDPFFTTKEVGRGTGQGLAIARSVIVDKHGGKLDVESEVGRGTTFTIRLPIAAPGPAA